MYDGSQLEWQRSFLLSRFAAHISSINPCGVGSVASLLTYTHIRQRIAAVRRVEHRRVSFPGD